MSAFHYKRRSTPRTKCSSMKKQINPTIKAHLIRSAFYVLLLLAVCVIPFALAQRNTKQRVAKPKATTHLAGAGKQSGAPASLAGTVHSPQRKPGAVDANLPYDLRSLPPRLPNSLTRAFAIAGLTFSFQSHRREQAGFPSSDEVKRPTGRALLRFLPQPKLPQVVLYDQYDNRRGHSHLVRDVRPIFLPSAPILLTTLSCPEVRLGMWTRSTLTGCTSMARDPPPIGMSSSTLTAVDFLARKFTAL